jgi:hypothetical protein
MTTDRNITERLADEADLWRNKGADDIAALLDDARGYINAREADIHATQRAARIQCDILRAEVARLTSERGGLLETLRDEMTENLRIRGLAGATSDETITAVMERVIRERDALTERAERAEAEAAALRAANEAFGKRQKWWNDTMVALESEATALRADAERYRWLRLGRPGTYNTVMIHAGNGLDAAVDAARAREADNG